MDENLRRAADDLLNALHETESWKHYAAIAITVAGIAIIGLLDP